MRSDLFISVDVEADGPYPIDFSMLSFGAYTEVDGIPKTFYAELKPISSTFDAGAVAVCEKGGLNRAKLVEFGPDPAQVMKEFTRWVSLLIGEQFRPVFVGFNASFDWQFINAYMIKFVGLNIFGINALDIKAYYMGKYGKERWSDTTKRKMPKHLFGTQPHTHNALDDATEQYQLFTKIYRGDKSC